MSALDIDGYSDVEVIGRGGFGTVYRARQVAFDRTVAIKVFAADGAGTDSLSTFERECRAVGRLDWCPSIVTVFNSGRTESGAPYLVMEYARGGSLANHLTSNGPLSEQGATLILERIAQALETAHGAGILHRDIKPANVLLTRTGQPLLTDFGIARLFGGGATTASVAGTVAYSAPEIWLDVPATPSSDIFSLGATIFACLTGHGPFSESPHDSVGVILNRATSGFEPNTTNLSVSAGLRSILARCLRSDPAARYSSARELLDDIDRLGATHSAQAPIVAALAPSSSNSPAPQHSWPEEFYQAPASRTTPRLAHQVWPSPSDYARIVQSAPVLLPGTPFEGASLTRDALGMPMSASGQNAIVFELSHDTGPLALRCYTRAPAGAEVRYHQLGAFLRENDSTPFVPAVWLSEGVVDKARSWPAIVMPWVAGLPINLAIEDMLDHPVQLRVLAGRWQAIAEALVGAQVAHGDLQCGNIIVDSSLAVRLVDLDGVYVPGMTSDPGETGHPNFQHPRRAISDWGPDVDAFSLLVLKLSLDALAADPTLWKFHNGENLILSRDDYLAPGRTGVWTRLATSPSPDVRTLADDLKRLAARSSAPRLSEVLPLMGIARSTVATTQHEPDNVRSLEPNSTWAPPLESTRVAPALTGAPTIRRDEKAPTDHPVAAWWDEAAVVRLLDREVPQAQGSASAPKPSAPTDVPVSVFGRRTSGLGRNASVLARNAAVRGITAGAAAGALALTIHALLRGAFPQSVQVGVLLVIVGAIMTALLTAAPLWAMDSKWEAIRQAWVGFLVGALAAMVGLGLFEIAAAMMGRKEEGPVPVGFLLIAWLAISMSMGLGTGVLRRSLRASQLGLLGGALGGLMGGIVHALSHPTFIDTSATKDGSSLVVLINPLDPATFAAVLVASCFIGGMIGTVDHLGRQAWLTVIEGPGRGLEVILDGNRATIGTNADATLRVRSDGVRGTYADIALDGTPRVTVHRDAMLGSKPLRTGDSVGIAPGDVLRLGSSYVRFDFKQSHR